MQNIVRQLNTYHFIVYYYGWKWYFVQIHWYYKYRLDYTMDIFFAKCACVCSLRYSRVRRHTQNLIMFIYLKKLIQRHEQMNLNINYPIFNLKCKNVRFRTWFFSFAQLNPHQPQRDMAFDRRGQQHVHLNAMMMMMILFFAIKQVFSASVNQPHKFTQLIKLLINKIKVWNAKNRPK